MNTKSNIITSILLLVAGIILIVQHDQIDLLGWIVMLMGVLFIIPSLYHLAMLLLRQCDNDAINRASRGPAIIAAVGGIGLGACMILRPEFFVGILVYLFAGILVLGGIIQLLLVAYGTRPLRAPWWMYVAPALITITGIVLLCTDIHAIESTVVLLTGIAFVMAAINSFLATVATRAVAAHHTSIDPTR